MLRRHWRSEQVSGQLGRHGVSLIPGKEHWRTERLRDISPSGKSVTDKIEAYIQTWETRCYAHGIADVVPDEITKAGLAPSYKAIAMAILLNKYSLLGIYPTGNVWLDLSPAKKAEPSMWDGL